MNPSQTQHLHDMGSSIEALNVRIARLAIGLGVSLRNDAEVTRVMAHRVTVVTTERRVTPERRSAPRPGPDRRLAGRYEELRGLLVLRYDVERHCVDEVGVVAVRRIMIEVEARMERDGFEPGADGIDLNRFLGEP